MNYYDRRIADRDALLGALINGDRHATAALARGDDLALLRRIVKAGLLDARGLAAERALMRGHSIHAVRAALGLTAAEYRPVVAAIYSTPRP